MYMQSSPARSDRLCGESQVTQARDSLELAKRDWSDHSSSRCPPELATIRVRIHQKCTAVIPTLSPVPGAREKSSQPVGLWDEDRGTAHLDLASAGHVGRARSWAPPGLMPREPAFRRRFRRDIDR